MKFIAVILSLFCLPAMAQFYIGGAIGHGDSNFPNSKPLHQSVQADYKYDSSIFQGFAGYRFGWFALEAGVTKLPTFRGKANIPDYPAYKPCTLTVGPGCPPSANGVQRIDAHALYLRGNVYLPKFHGMEPYLFAGAAKSFVKNEEHATYAGHEPDADFYDSYKLKTVLYGAGVQFALNGSWSVRAEAMLVPTFTDEYHTSKRDASMVTLGLIYGF